MNIPKQLVLACLTLQIAVWALVSTAHEIVHHDFDQHCVVCAHQVDRANFPLAPADYGIELPQAASERPESNAAEILTRTPRGVVRVRGPPLI